MITLRAKFTWSWCIWIFSVICKCSQAKMGTFFYVLSEQNVPCQKMLWQNIWIQCSLVIKIHCNQNYVILFPKNLKVNIFYKYIILKIFSSAFIWSSVPTKILNFYEAAKTYKNSKTFYFIKIQNYGGNSNLIPD